MAIELPPEVKAALADLAAQLDRANLRGLRLVRPQGIHLTLKFLGDLPADEVEPVAEAVSQIAKEHSPFTLALGGPGVFPDRDVPRVLWVGIEGDPAPLMALHLSVEKSLAALGFPRDNRGFSPHLTVARIRDGTSERDRKRAVEALFSAGTGLGLQIDVGEVSLMQSTLSPDGARYARIASAPLGHDSSMEGSG